MIRETRTCTACREVWNVERDSDREAVAVGCGCGSSCPRGGHEFQFGDVNAADAIITRKLPNISTFPDHGIEDINFVDNYYLDYKNQLDSPRQCPRMLASGERGEGIEKDSLIRNE